jgi:hypothetical protein
MLPGAGQGIKDGAFSGVGITGYGNVQLFHSIPTKSVILNAAQRSEESRIFTTIPKRIAAHQTGKIWIRFR